MKREVAFDLMREAASFHESVLNLVSVWQAIYMTQGKGMIPEDAAGVALLVGAAVYACAWVVVGKVDEVRIFLPFALGLAPLAVEMAMVRVDAKAYPRG